MAGLRLWWGWKGQEFCAQGSRPHFLRPVVEIQRPQLSISQIGGVGVCAICTARQESK